MKDFAGRLFRMNGVNIGLGLIVGQGAIVLSTPLLTRLYSPEHMGSAGIFLALASIVGTVATLRLELFIPSAPALEARVIARDAPLILSLVAVLAGLGFFFLFPGHLFNAILFSCTVAGLGGTQLSLQFAARHKALSGVAYAKAGQGLAQAGSQLVAGAMALTTFGMQLGYALGYSTSMLSQGIAARRAAPKLKEPSLVARAEFFRRYWRRAAMLTLAALLNVFTIWMYPVLTQVFFGAVETGHVTVAQRFAIIPASLVVATVAPIVIGAAGDRIRHSLELSSLVRTWLVRLIPLGAVVSLVLFFVPQSWVILLLGAEWGPVGLYFQPMAVLVGSQLIVGPLSQILVIQGRTGLQFLWDLIRSLALLGVSVAVAVVTKDPVLMIWGASGVLAFFHLIYMFLIFLPYDPRPALKEV